jgi:hypothetical protein
LVCFQAVVLNGKIYCVGGFDGHERLASVETLDLTRPGATWTLSSALLTPRSNFGITVVDKKILVAGGFDGSGVILGSELFSEAANTWRPFAPMNLKKSALCLVTVKDLPNRKVYLGKRRS